MLFQLSSSDDENQAEEEQSIHQFSAKPFQRSPGLDNVELNTAGFCVEEHSVSLDLEEHMSAFDNLNETIASAHAHAQVILDAYNSDQDILFAGPEDEDEPISEAHIESLCITQEYIHLLQNAILDEDKLDSETLNCLQNSIQGPLDIIDPDQKLSLELFTATKSSEATYNQCRSAIL